MRKFNVLFCHPQVKFDLDWFGFHFRRWDPPRYGGMDWILSLGVVQVRHWRKLTDEDYEKLGVKRKGSL